jgi:hypothetical protein
MLMFSFHANPQCAWEAVIFENPLDPQLSTQTIMIMLEARILTS